jgi:oligopeptide/dipeptide ABC transporter ATP-binding protein
MTTTATEPRGQVKTVPGAPLLEVRGLTKHFPVRARSLVRGALQLVRAVDDVSFTLREGETLGLVGESGCGKTTTGRMITRLIEPTAGQILYKGVDIAHMKERQLRPYRREIQLIFQDPYSSLNPRHTVGTIVGTALDVHNVVPKNKRLARIQELLEVVGLNPEHYNRYPSQFSGGQRQRIGVARALAVQPKVIVADEPVSALDVSIQAQVMNLLGDLRKEFGLAFIFISHDLGVIRQFCDRINVMYLGKTAELGNREQIYELPNHPYTQALLSAEPDVGVVRGTPPKARIRLVGDVPSPIDPPSGCRFHTRCWKAQEICSQVVPPLERKPTGQLAACHFAEPPKVSLLAELDHQTAAEA